MTIDNTKILDKTKNQQEKEDEKNEENIMQKLKQDLDSKDAVSDQINLQEVFSNSDSRNDKQVNQINIEDGQDGKENEPLYAAKVGGTFIDDGTSDNTQVIKNELGIFHNPQSLCYTKYGEDLTPNAPTITPPPDSKDVDDKQEQDKSLRNSQDEDVDLIQQNNEEQENSLKKSNENIVVLDEKHMQELDQLEQKLKAPTCQSCEYKQLDPKAYFCSKCGVKLVLERHKPRGRKKHQIQPLVKSSQSELEQLGIKISTDQGRLLKISIKRRELQNVTLLNVQMMPLNVVTLKHTFTLGAGTIFAMNIKVWLKLVERNVAGIMKCKMNGQINRMYLQYVKIVKEVNIVEINVFAIVTQQCLFQLQLQSQLSQL